MLIHLGMLTCAYILKYAYICLYILTIKAVRVGSCISARNGAMLYDDATLYDSATLYDGVTLYNNGATL